MNKWSRDRMSCLNCKSENRKHVAKGYCTKCYPFFRRITLAEKWDLNDEKTLRYFPKSPYFKELKTFARVKKGLIAQWQERLNWLRYREEKLKGNFDGLDLELGFERLARLAGVRNKLFDGLAGWLEMHFNQKQRRVIFEMINRIEQEVGWEGIDWNRVFESTSTHATSCATSLSDNV